MKPIRYIVFIVSLCIPLTLVAWELAGSDDAFIYHTTNPKTENITLYYKDNSGKRIGTLGNLKTHLGTQGKTLLFGMNGGMFMEDFTAVGLYIENGKTIRELNTRNAGATFT